MKRSRTLTGAAAGVVSLPLLGLLASSGCDTQAPLDFGRTPDGPGARVRFDLAHVPLPDVPLPSDVATWPDPTSRTGLRVNASLLAPTEIERDARERFDRLEGWGTFMPITIGFDLARVGDHDKRPHEAAVDLASLAARHQGDDYDFADDAIYLVNLATGVPVPLDLGSGNFDYTLKKLDSYWANDTRATERNLLFDTIDESRRGALAPEDFDASLDTDFDGVLDVPNLDDPFVCPDPDPACDNPKDPAFGDAACLDKRRNRDRCITDHLLTHYERETDTIVARPLIPLDQASKYAVVVTDRLTDANGDPVKSPFGQVFHASQRAVAERVAEVIDDGARAAYFGDVAGTGIGRVAFTWGFTTQPTVDDLKLLRDGLYGKGPFERFAQEFPTKLELPRAIGKVSGLEEGATDPAGWESLPECAQLSKNLYVIDADEIRPLLKVAVEQLFGTTPGPDTIALLRDLESVDRLVFGTYEVPYLLEGGPQSTDSKAAFNLDFATGEGEVTRDTVQFWMMIPKETAQHKQPFDVNLYGHGYTGNLLEQVFYAGGLAKHGLATIGINAAGHGADLGDAATEQLAKALFAGGCIGPFADAFVKGRGRDLDDDGRADSGGDFWSSYLFHTRDGVRQSVLDHSQLGRILRSFGTAEGAMVTNATARDALPRSSQPRIAMQRSATLSGLD